MKIAYFGTPAFSTLVLDKLEKAKLLPALVVTRSDKPAGRGLEVRRSPVKESALRREIPVIEPETFSGVPPELKDFDVYIVAAYGKIIPKALLDIPRYGTLNVHPSLLPKYRGPSPIEQQILDDVREVGVSVILLDEEADHGPVLAQKAIALGEMKGRTELERMLWAEGGALLASILPAWVLESSGRHEGEYPDTIVPEPQKHAEATFTPRISKEDGLIDLAGNPRKNYLKYLAYEGWPGTYFLSEKNGEKKRVKIASAEFVNGTFTPLRVIPEGKREMAYADFLINR
jgi:methionyl-tRNA formyltransferase